jgi:DNA-binding transcriptional LysR family regulator
VQLTEADPPVSLPRLTNGDFDAVLAYDYPSMAVAKDPGLRWQVVAEDPMAVALPPGDALSSRDRLTMSDLAGRVFIAPYNCVCRDALADAARRAGYVLDIASETNDYLAMLGLVAAGVGVAILPRLITPFTLPGVTLLPLVDQRLRRSVAIVTRASGYAPQSLATFTDLAASLTPALACPQLPSQRATEPAC